MPAEDRPRPANMSREELVSNLVLGLAEREWNNLTGEDGTDLEAEESWATGYQGARTQGVIFILSKYSDGGRKFALVSSTGVRPEPKQVTTDEAMLGWLWEEIRGGKEGADPVPD